MTTLSVNVNKVATLRNARGGNTPDVIHFAKVCEQCGADGITVHPRPDERHIRRSDVFALKQALTKEFNIEGYPSDDFIQLVKAVQPTQVTLVPDDPSQLTSDHGWNVVRYFDFLKSLVEIFHNCSIRVSFFVDPVCEIIEKAKETGVDRVELYTGPYAEMYDLDRTRAINMYKAAAECVNRLGLGMNAGHDLNLRNLSDFISNFPWTKEVSIGQALIADALYYGIEKTIGLYKSCLNQ